LLSRATFFFSSDASSLLTPSEFIVTAFLLRKCV
jgi:hypothetical protein